MTYLQRYLCAALLLASSGSVLALPLSRTEITIYDGDSSAPTGWAGKQEDEEVEPGMVATQGWDLESFFIDNSNNRLGMIAGFNFFNTNGGDERAGDIFIDVNGDHIAGNATNGSGANGNQNVANTFGYDYVLDINWANLTYNVLQLSGSSIVQTARYGQNYGSSPWSYISGGTTLFSNLSFSGDSLLTNLATGKLGGTHYAAYGFDLGFLGANATYTAHFTAACGNDNLMGAVPIPAAAWLFGGALGALGLLKRRLARA